MHDISNMLVELCQISNLSCIGLTETMLEGFGAVPLSMDGITQAVWSTPDGQHMPLERIRSSVQQLASDKIGYISRAGERAGPALGGNSYSVSILACLEINDEQYLFTTYRFCSDNNRMMLSG